MSATKELAKPARGTRLHLLVCLGADFDCAYIPHLCRYYTPAVDSWIVLLHSNDHGEKGEGVTATARRAFESGIAAVSSNAALTTRAWYGEFDPYTKVDRLNEMVRELVPSGEWVVHVDADEFVESPDDLKTLVAQCTAGQQKVVYGCMVDRFAPGRKPQPIHDEDDLFIKFPECEEYTKTVIRAWTHKAFLMQYEDSSLLLNCHDYSGQSWPDYQRSGRPAPIVWHFKWVESTREKLKHRVYSFRRQGLGWWKDSATGLKEIYREETPHPQSAEGRAMSNPYASLEARAFWKTGVAEGLLPEIWRPKWRLRHEDRVVTFGSCFARHLGPALRARGFTWLETEPPPANLRPESARRFGYGHFSCRTEAITTPTALRQWVAWALGDEHAPDEQWRAGNRVIDPFRPSIEPQGFASRTEMMTSRQQAIDSLRRAILEADVFLFTLGMTESWVHSQGGWVYPACPGTIGGRFDPARHRFWNLSFVEAQRALVEALERLWAARPELKVLLTVSPVPLTATASGSHVLTANSCSKATLRAIAGELADRLPAVDYFPSYEIVTGPAPGGQMFEPNRRSVSAWGVAQVMDAFFAAHSLEKPAGSSAGPVLPDHSIESEADCDDAWAEAFRK